MAIERIYPYKDLRSIVFHVSEAVEVYDGQIAIILNHLFNHLKMLANIAPVMSTKDVIEQILPHRKHYGLSGDWENQVGEWKRLAKMVSDECTLLVNYYHQILALNAELSPETSALIEAKMNDIVSEVQSRIPFFNYGYPDARSERD